MKIHKYLFFLLGIFTFHCAIAQNSFLLNDGNVKCLVTIHEGDSTINIDLINTSNKLIYFIDTSLFNKTEWIDKSGNIAVLELNYGIIHELKGNPHWGFGDIAIYVLNRNQKCNFQRKITIYPKQFYFHIDYNIGKKKIKTIAAKKYRENIKILEYSYEPD